MRGMIGLRLFSQPNGYHFSTWQIFVVSTLLCGRSCPMGRMPWTLTVLPPSYINVSFKVYGLDGDNSMHITVLK